MGEVQGNGWKMFFDGASNRFYGAGVVIITPEGARMPFAVKLGFASTNNMAEYEACISGMKALLALGVKEVEVHGDSSLVLAQTQGVWKSSHMTIAETSSLCAVMHVKG